MAAGGEEVDGARLVAMLRSAVEGIMARGQAELGDKTLLDALVPMTDRIEAELAAGADSAAVVAAAAATADQAAEATIPMLARRGRAAYTGERSRGSVDAGAKAEGRAAERRDGATAERECSKCVRPCGVPVGRDHGPHLLAGHRRWLVVLLCCRAHRLLERPFVRRPAVPPFRRHLASGAKSASDLRSLARARKSCAFDVPE
jgi:hypothetical protein